MFPTIEFLTDQPNDYLDEICEISNTPNDINFKIKQLCEQIQDNLEWISSEQIQETKNPDFRNIESISSDSQYIKKKFKIRETQQLLQHCLILIEQNHDIKLQTNLLVHNLLHFFQNQVTLVSSLKDNTNYDSYSETDTGDSSTLSKYITIADNDHLYNQILQEQLIATKQIEMNTQRLLDIHNFIYGEVIQTEEFINDIDSNIQLTNKFTGTQYLLNELERSSNYHYTKYILKVFICFLIFILFILVPIILTIIRN
ncbi:uncharacterized protein CMU_026600 [Cryptosporidium muris RN66]|uniref:t-SNARE coiled-coil homology domain-containing protein n=1 Tax=Cryptosporidium muris (strain RN66) TaxID=441375 RepID=B6ABA0_CRYMR|nr:uncharacterized protein CMU_026600 [Cryptosporidium muris RN66]EEA05652.1 hypothetical protein CMU_026600 [Cryptosporidium muris RN66]|eukprot:XP_002140001.1 hypothetical protein [Cryptosporidium muris RN66]